ncbi:unnamed protein product [Brachionus calyciflorus]|uniref:Transmembrane protein n=1 Tax=Brachionus calyciflorus TaxID=104777 RepID=A0A814EUA4_9BILA|nr:unnamed protein product [Brachionus calyciflorus]
MDQIAGIMALYQLNQYVFKVVFKFFKWLLMKNLFRNYCKRLKRQYELNKIPILSLFQINYIFIMGCLIFSIYYNLIFKKDYLPIKLVCYFILVYSSVLSAFETVKYLISQNSLDEYYQPVLLEYQAQEIDENNVSKCISSDYELN